MRARLCLKCGHRWVKRVVRESVECPRCKRTDWDKPHKKRYRVKHRWAEYKPAVPNGPFDPLPGREDPVYHLIIKAGLWQEVDFGAFEVLRDSRPDIDWSELVVGVIGEREVRDWGEFGLWGKLVHAAGSGEWLKKAAQESNLAKGTTQNI